MEHDIACIMQFPVY